MHWTRSVSAAAVCARHRRTRSHALLLPACAAVAAAAAVPVDGGGGRIIDNDVIIDALRWWRRAAGWAGCAATATDWRAVPRLGFASEEAVRIHDSLAAPIDYLDRAIRGGGHRAALAVSVPSFPCAVLADPRTCATLHLVRSCMLSMAVERGQARSTRESVSMALQVSRGRARWVDTLDGWPRV